MKSFEPSVFERHRPPMRLVRTINRLGEAKGKQELYAHQSPQTLETLRRISVVQSVESSNRIEGVVVPDTRFQQLMAEKTRPANRSESEVAGYRNVLATIHASYHDIPVTPNVILQFHRDLFQYESDRGGHWKSADNQIIERAANGSERVRFEPPPAWQTLNMMDQLCGRYRKAIQEGEIEPLLLIPNFVLDFLCIHPFPDGNGRMARLLTVLLLHRAGYDVARYVSLERLVEDTGQSYYDALEKSSIEWNDGKHDLLPWWTYFLGILTAAYKELEDGVALARPGKGSKTESVKLAIEQLPEPFTIADIESACPHVSRALIRKVLNSLKGSRVRLLNVGRNAAWERM